MTRSFDDPSAYMRRWGRLSEFELQRRAQHDPLLFAADHCPVAERQAGCLVIVAIRTDGQPLMVVIQDAPEEPTDDDCLGVLAGCLPRLGAAVNDAGDLYGWAGAPVARLGVVTHRRGRPHITAEDRRWVDALEAVCRWSGVGPLGVVTRTEAGAIVRPPLSMGAAS
jgi:hypothetical protein